MVKEKVMVRQTTVRIRSVGDSFRKTAGSLLGASQKAG